MNTKKITLGILAHVDAGKTTLSEGMLYLSGTIRKLGRVDHKDAFLDTYELERARGITIFSKQALFDWKNNSFTLLDTPGHSDFSPEMERTLQVLDGAVLIISAADGVTSQVRLLWKLLSHYQVPTFIFVNKMDQAGSDKAAILEHLKKELGSNVIDFSDGTASPDTQEELAVCDDSLLSAFLEGKEVSDSDITGLICNRKSFPVIFGSALKMQGVEELLNLITTHLSPSAEDGSGAFGARVYKISRDNQGNRLTHLKVTGGVIKVRDLIGEEKIDQIRIYNGEKFEAVKEAGPGTICAVTGLSSTKAGEGLGCEKKASEAELIQPIISCSLILPEETDTLSFYKKLMILQEEEPMLRISLKDLPGTSEKQIEAQVMGEVQKEILHHLIKERFDTDISFGPGHIVYKETIASAVEGVGHFEPLRHYAEVHLLMEPAEPGSGIILDNICSTDVLALNWQRLILTHLQEKAHKGVLTGSEITDIKITLLTGRAHEKHTEGGDFRQATYRAVRQGLMESDSVLLEPMFNYRMVLPQESVGRALNDIQRMNGTVGLPDMEGGKSVLTGTIPAACLGDYASELTSYTHGEGYITTTLSGYAPCHNPEEVIASFAYDPEADQDNPSSSVFCSHGAGTLIPWNEVRSYMHLDTGWNPETGFEKKTDLTDSIDMEALKKLQAHKRKDTEDNRSFAEIDREIRATNNELMAIFERTYGQIKPRYVENYEERRRTKDTPLASEGPAPEVSLSKKKAAGLEAKSALIERPKEYLLVDGYNVIYASPELSSLAQTDLKAARDALIDLLVNFAGFRREIVILVFDAYKVPGGTEHIVKHHDLTVIYTKEAETADQYIEKAAHEIGKKYKVTVATSDNIEQVIVMSSGALRLSARDFLLEIKHTEEQIKEKMSKF
ncbi:translation factor GTPase family protein [Butyrivibrio sp. AE3009]|uniref:translation factor GTPase family protein n=1 Tax=Butyrivibrio sp. AE3009 TaxID=1280666 RepID=UPI0003B77F74|nr:TetM/TetW/TetO/TetS family tetracycline resistance ribosomal protection protein [Butyrivibrio sp. AE3009]